MQLKNFAKKTELGVFCAVLAIFAKFNLVTLLSGEGPLSKTDLRFLSCPEQPTQPV